MSDVELMWDQVGMLIVQVVVWYMELFVGIFMCVITQCKVVYMVNLFGKQMVLWFVEYQFVIKENFMQGYVGFFSIQVSIDIGQ